MTAHDLATGTSWAVIDRPYNSDASRLFLSMSAHSKFLEIWRSGVISAAERRDSRSHRFQPVENSASSYSVRYARKTSFVATRLDLFASFNHRLKPVATRTSPLRG